ncbi:unnamed protein product [Ilex paraguariensis]|uniref:LAGLIDADG homing endonuclease n=1 Tax=Ilex paraguariensis TaxID=185542 RepID=A0ABC8T6I4_9AQUA
MASISFLEDWGVVCGGFVEVDRQTKNRENLFAALICIHKPESSFLRTSLNTNFNWKAYLIQVKVFSCLGKMGRDERMRLFEGGGTENRYIITAVEMEGRCKKGTWH